MNPRLTQAFGRPMSEMQRSAAVTPMGGVALRPEPAALCGRIGLDAASQLQIQELLRCPTQGTRESLRPG